MATYYWGNGGTSGTGTWNSSSITNWWTDVTRLIPALTAPTSTDDVVIDTSSGTGTITCTGAVCNNLTVTASQAIILGATGSSLSIYGNLSYPAGGSFSASTNTITTTFAATSTGKTITTNGKTLRGLIFNGVGGGWTLQDTLNATASTTTTITLDNGSLNTNNQAVNCAIFTYSATGTASLTLGTSTVTLSGTGTPWNFATTTGLTFSGASSTIVLSNTTTNPRTFAGGGLTYGTLTIGGTTGISTTTITGANTFSTLSETKTVANTISFGANQTIGTWSVTGSAGNVVTVNSSVNGTARTLTITNRTSGINYLDVQDITANLAPVTFYAGANTLLRSNVQGVAAIAPTANQFIYVLTSGTSFTVPADWNNSNNEIHLFAGGGGGAGTRSSGANTAAGGGGGGAGYTKLTNQTLSGTITYAIGAGGSGGASSINGNAGGTTSWNSGASTAGGGGGGQATTTPTSTGGTAGTGSTFNGGVGGAGGTATVGSTGNGSGGGAGAGGPLGAGQNGGNGFSSLTNANVAGGGGGGNGGGTAGGNASSATGGTGGNNNAGVGGGASATAGFNGGGAGGQVGGGTSFYGSSGIDISNAGMGSGGGAGGARGQGAVGGLYGAGGSGGGIGTGGTANSGAAGAQGAIIIVYSTSTTAINNAYFLMFG